MTPQQRYKIAASKILPAVSEKNPYLKEQVGHTIYDFVQIICGNADAPKVTGMLIELPYEQIRQYLDSFENLQIRVNEALELINDMQSANPEEQQITQK